MDKKELRQQLRGLGIPVRNGKVKKSDIVAVLKRVTAEPESGDKFFLISGDNYMEIPKHVFDLFHSRKINLSSSMSSLKANDQIIQKIKERGGKFVKDLKVQLKGDDKETWIS